MTPARWLLDNSALSRLDRSQVAEVLVRQISSGAVGVSVLIELEVGFSARSTSDYRVTRRTIVNRLLPVPLPFRGTGP